MGKKATIKAVNRVDEILNHNPSLIKASRLATKLLDENEYQNHFREKMKEKGIESPKQLSSEEKGAFFKDVKASWKKKKMS